MSNKFESNKSQKKEDKEMKAKGEAQRRIEIINESRELGLSIEEYQEIISS